MCTMRGETSESIVCLHVVHIYSVLESHVVVFKMDIVVGHIKKPSSMEGKFWRLSITQCACVWFKLSKRLLYFGYE